MSIGVILELILIGSKIFSDERKEYFANRSKKLLATINMVEDSAYYQKDMEAKGQAQRQLMLDTEELRKQFVLESAR